jgi:predicted DNA binding protein
MRKGEPLGIIFRVKNEECKVSELLRENGVKEFKIIGIRPYGDKMIHAVEIREGTNRVRMLESEGCGLCKLLSSTKAFLISANMRNDEMRCEVILPSRQTLRKLSSALKSYKGFRIISIVKRGRMLTERQEEVLLTAVRMGYFDFPRRIRTRELADMLGMSQASLTEILRRAVKKLVMEYYRDLMYGK